MTFTQLYCLSQADLHWIQSILRLIEFQLRCLFNGRCVSTFQVNDLISNNQLNICSEEKVFTAVLSWLKHDLSERKQHIAEVTLQIKNNKILCSTNQSKAECDKFCVPDYFISLYICEHYCSDDDDPRPFERSS